MHSVISLRVIILDHEFVSKATPLKMIRVKQVPDLVSTFFRYSHWRMKRETRGIKSYIDIFDVMGYHPVHGVPLGGIGSGTITRGFRGDFTRFHLIPGRYEYHSVFANQFLVTIRKRNHTVFSQVLSPLRPKGRGLSAWNWSMHGGSASYRALYPRAFTEYELPGQSVRLRCTQISPVIPHDYRDSCLPVALFKWDVLVKEGETLEESLDVTITFVFQSGRGSSEDKRGRGIKNEKFSCSSIGGVLLRNVVNGSMPCTFAVSAKNRGSRDADVQPGDVNVSSCVGFDPASSGEELWRRLLASGRLDGLGGDVKEGEKGHHLACAVAAQIRVDSSSDRNQVEFCLTWDMPTVQFGSKGVSHRRRYTRWFSGPDAAVALTKHAFEARPQWEAAIEEWQRPVLEDASLPDWFKSAVFNELYFIADGGTVWLETQDVPFTQNKPKKASDDLRKEYGRFGYLEGHEYLMYNTYDVHFYASFALVHLWPNLQLSLNLDFGDTVDFEDATPCKALATGDVGPAKALHSVPHDLGNPADEPWIRTNCYNMHLTQDWRDLNLKFVLQAYRDYAVTKNKDYIRDLFPRMEMVMKKALSTQDSDGDGMIENSGQADQTYDAWRVKGVSSYCGGLWLASLRCVVELLSDPDLGVLPVENDREEKLAFYSNLLQRAAKIYEYKLWNGCYFRYDESNSGYGDSIMADQLCGWFYLVASGLEENSPFVKSHCLKALTNIYQFNVMKYMSGSCGAVNGMRPDGSVDISSPQSEEVWTGVTYSLAALMISQGMVNQGFQTAKGMYQTLWEETGLQFQTPEAFMKHRRTFRSLAYMRPLAVWAMKTAWDGVKDKIAAEEENCDKVAGLAKVDCVETGGSGDRGSVDSSTSIPKDSGDA